MGSGQLMPVRKRSAGGLFTQRTQAVERATTVLDLFSLHQPELSLTAISTRLGMHPSTAHRLLKTMQDAGLLAQVAGAEAYRLGPKLLTLGGRMLLQHSVREVAAPILRQLTHELGETVGLSRYEDGFVVYLDCVEGPHPVSVTLRPGGRAPAHCVASGRAMLAHMEAGELDRLIARGLETCSPGTIANPDALARELGRIRARGYAVDDGDWRPGVRAAAAAVLDATGRPVASVTTVGFAGDLTMPRMHILGARVRSAAQEISRLLGHPADPSVTAASTRNGSRQG